MTHRCLWAAPAVLICTSGGAAQPALERPTGALDGKVVYLHAGHGWTANNLGSGSWTTQRGETFEIVEDLLNQDMHTMQAESLWNAGATIVPLRPVDHQPLEVVLDNDDSGVTFSGAWSDSVSPVYFGDPGDLPYRFAAASPVETAVARYVPAFSASGFYPVYAWTRAGGDRVEQLYRVLHAGGATEVTIDHTKVGNGLVYLGTYRFEVGVGHGVEISNRSDQTGVVIADMIRFGNGMGDIDRGGGVSGQLREDEAGLYWIQAHRGVGIPDSEYRVSSSDGSATVSAPPRWAEQMNREASGSLSDRVFISHHSNAANTVARGVISLYNGNNNPASETPNQFLLAFLTAGEINEDMPLLDSEFEHPWFKRTTITLDRTDFEFGEITNTVINDEFDATIIERGFHDNQLDAELLRDPLVAEAIARSTTQGLVRFFSQIDGGQTPVAFAPVRVEGVRVTTDPAGTATVAWEPPASGPALGDPALAYRVQLSSNGLGFDAGVETTLTSATIETPIDGSPVFVRVVATNAGGWSPPSAVVAAARGTTPVLIVDGYDRLDRLMNVRQPYFSGETDRSRVRNQNPRNGAVRAAVAIDAFDADVRIDSADNDAVIAGGVTLADYDAVVWTLGQESFGSTFESAEQTLAAAYIEGGGDLIVTGSEVAYDLNVLNTGFLFLLNTLGALFVADDAATDVAFGEAGTEFEGLPIEFDRGLSVETYSVNSPDVIGPLGDSSSRVAFVAGVAGSACVVNPGSGGAGDAVLLTVPFETIETASVRASVMSGLFQAIGLEVISPCPADTNDDGELTPADFNAWVLAFNSQSVACDQNGDGLCAPSDFNAWVLNFNAGCP
ncbi:MAG: GC-type dockerin domain-anchored protein [Planctomycetota bacterium]